MKNLDQIFYEALQLAAEDRDAFLTRACAEEGIDRGEVEALLAAHEKAGGFLKQPPPASVDAWLGRKVGVYELVRELGVGGSGRVFEGRRTTGDFAQRVAVKILRHALDAAEQARRFGVECEALSRLEHPNIARLIDAGATEDARAYLIVELVEGETLPAHCDKRRLRVSERLRLFRTVCQAVEYAHTNLVVHRDLKPDNILVTDDGQVKLLDFGIAKLLDPADAAETMTTHQRLTPRYASPEQLRAQPVTTRSDVYSLGVLLYQLVTGRLPHESDDTTSEAWARTVTTGEVTRPSEAVGDEHSALRRETTNRLRRRLRGDLDRILLKAVHADPDQRYASPARLAEDLDRFLTGQPVLARPDTVGYRLSKFLRRNRVAVALAGVALASLVAATFVSTTTVLNLRREQKESAVQRRTAEETVAFLSDLLASADPVQTQTRDALTVNQLMDTARDRVADELAGQPRVAASLQQTIARGYLNLDRLGAADSVQTEAVARLSKELGPRHMETALARSDLAYIKMKRSEYDTAAVIYADALAHLNGATPGVRAEIASEWADVLAQQGNFESAKTKGEQAVALAREDTVPKHLLAVLNNVGLAMVRAGHPAESIELFREAAPLARAYYGPQHSHTGKLIQNLGYALQTAGRPEESEPVFREAMTIYENVFGPDSPQTAAVQVSLANTLGALKKYDEAEPLHRKAIATMTSVLGPNHPNTGHSLHNLGAMFMLKGDYDQAVAQIFKAVPIYEEVFGPEHPNVAAAVYNLARCYRRNDQREQALAAARKSLQIRQAALREDHPDLARTSELMGRLMMDVDDPAAAEPWFRRAHDIRRKAYAVDNAMRIQSERELGSCLAALSRYAEAESLLTSALSGLVAKHGTDHEKAQSCEAELAALREKRSDR
jgi:serine/threonine-protein kinase